MHACHTSCRCQSGGRGRGARPWLPRRAKQALALMRSTRNFSKLARSMIRSSTGLLRAHGGGKLRWRLGASKRRLPTQPCLPAVDAEGLRLLGDSSALLCCRRHCRWLCVRAGQQTCPKQPGLKGQKRAQGAAMAASPRGAAATAACSRPTGAPERGLAQLLAHDALLTAARALAFHRPGDLKRRLPATAGRRPVWPPQSCCYRALLRSSGPPASAVAPRSHEQPALRMEGNVASGMACPRAGDCVASWQQAACTQQSAWLRRAALHSCTWCSATCVSLPHTSWPSRPTSWCASS